MLRQVRLRTTAMNSKFAVMVLARPLHSSHASRSTVQGLLATDNTLKVTICNSIL
jgi:hypothetical protein